MPPLRHAMGLVDGETSDGRIFEAGENVVPQEPFRRDVEKAQRPLPKPPRDLPPLLDFGRRVEARRLDPQLPQLRHLTAHQRDQWRHHQRQALPGDRRELKAERLPAASRHDGENVLAFKRRRENLLLARAEGGKAIDARERRARFRHQRRIFIHVSASGSNTGVHCTASTRSAPVASITSAVEAERRPARIGHMCKRRKEILIDRSGNAIDPLLVGHVGLEPAQLLFRIDQFVEGVCEFEAAAIELEPLGHPRVVRTRLEPAPLRSRDSCARWLVAQVQDGARPGR